MLIRHVCVHYKPINVVPFLPKLQKQNTKGVKKSKKMYMLILFKVLPKSVIKLFVIIIHLLRKSHIKSYCYISQVQYT